MPTPARCDSTSFSVQAIILLELSKSDKRESELALIVMLPLADLQSLLAQMPQVHTCQGVCSLAGGAAAGGAA